MTEDTGKTDEPGKLEHIDWFHRNPDMDGIRMVGDKELDLGSIVADVPGIRIGKTDKVEAKVDRADVCLREWIERGRGYRNSEVWNEWVKDTEEALEAHRFEREQRRKDRTTMAALVHRAIRLLLGHNVAAVRTRLLKLEDLLKGEDKAR